MNQKIKDILEYFDTILKDAHCELNYQKDYELLFAVILSAQTTDKKVNAVTEVLFKKYPTLSSFANAKREDVEAIIRPLGLSKTKSNNLVETARKLINYDKVPNDLNILLSFNGVGIKTAKVVLGELYNVPCIAVDTHVERCSKRLKLVSKNETPERISIKLEKIIPLEKQNKFHHQMIHFGRYYCLSRNPKCESCNLKQYCTYFHKLEK